MKIMTMVYYLNHINRDRAIVDPPQSNVGESRWGDVLEMTGET